ncbi:hypothetical protein [Neobacillus vireti]|uniref:hypothetical protein n=1 Tax=Neobacillus vireti TaxID=220686 RepID=UPI003000199D
MPINTGSITYDSKKSLLLHGHYDPAILLKAKARVMKWKNRQNVIFKNNGHLPRIVEPEKYL